jgi:NTE family protein
MSEWITEADGVFRGGGVKGLGLAGALLGFARHPTKPVTKWVNVAGASAGAIIASYLACGHDADDLQKLLRETNFAQFQDFPPGGKVLGGGFNLLTRHGLAHGKAFLEWFDEKLDHAPFSCTKTADGKRYRLKLIACDVTHRQLLVLPDDLPLYREPGERDPIDPDTFPIARAARMSMSIPYFFEPVTLVRIDTGKKATIVDGGTLSNFPVWIFDVEHSTPARPTFGFTLRGGRGVGAGLTRAERFAPWVLRLGFDIFHTAQEAWDTRFVSHSTRVRTLAVDAGNIGTTQFDLSAQDQQMLIDNGIAAANEFLDQFDLASYMNTFHQTIVPEKDQVPA